MLRELKDAQDTVTLMIEEAYALFLKPAPVQVEEDEFFEEPVSVIDTFDIHGESAEEVTTKIKHFSKRLTVQLSGPLDIKEEDMAWM
jgi:hypothetical protein